MVAVVGLIFALQEGPERGWTDAASLTGLGVGLVAAVAFVAWQLHRRDALRSWTCACSVSSGLAGGSLTLLVVFGVQAGVAVVLFPFFQAVLGWSGLLSTLALMPMALMMMVLSGAAPKVAARIGSRSTMAAGIALGAAGLALMALFVSVDGQLPDHPARHDRHGCRHGPGDDAVHRGHHHVAAARETGRRLRAQRRHPRVRHRARRRPARRPGLRRLPQRHRRRARRSPRRHADTAREGIANALEASGGAGSTPRTSCAPPSSPSSTAGSRPCGPAWRSWASCPSTSPCTARRTPSPPRVPTAKSPRPFLQVICARPGLPDVLPSPAGAARATPYRSPGAGTRRDHVDASPGRHDPPGTHRSRTRPTPRHQPPYRPPRHRAVARTRLSLACPPGAAGYQLGARRPNAAWSFPQSSHGRPGAPLRRPPCVVSGVPQFPAPHRCGRARDAGGAEPVRGLDRFLTEGRGRSGPPVCVLGEPRHLREDHAYDSRGHRGRTARRPRHRGDPRRNGSSTTTSRWRVRPLARRRQGRRSRAFPRVVGPRDGRLQSRHCSRRGNACAPRCAGRRRAPGRRTAAQEGSLMLLLRALGQPRPRSGRTGRSTRGRPTCARRRSWWRSTPGASESPDRPRGAAAGRQEAVHRTSPRVVPQRNAAMLRATQSLKRRGARPRTRSTSELIRSSAGFGAEMMSRVSSASSGGYRTGSSRPWPPRG